MAMEDSVTQKINQLVENKDEAGLTQLAEEAEITFDGDLKARALDALAQLRSEKDAVTPSIGGEIDNSQVEKLGGDPDTVAGPINEKISQNDEEMEAVLAQANKEIEEMDLADENTFQRPAAREDIEAYIGHLSAKELALREDYKKLIREILKAAQPEVLDRGFGSPFNTEAFKSLSETDRQKKRDEVIEGLADSPNTDSRDLKFFEEAAEQNSELMAKAKEAGAIANKIRSLNTEMDLYKNVDYLLGMDDESRKTAMQNFQARGQTEVVSITQSMQSGQ